ncbi:DUF3994 domain-containing protein [Heyndrickxia sp. FSL W8-0423]|uniref:DUF3994 domain-containing protein n=1 Tax=Heyndrickxia sp. FSL W8-0423 TaxID=2921601 RepID=UPI0030F72D60
MNKKKLLCFAIPLMLLGGCGDATVKKTAKQIESSETKKESKPETPNISKDSKEIAGTWGEDAENGFNVALIIHPDGIFEQYMDDTYPKKTDYVKGHWEYDSEAKILKLTNDIEFYQDGERKEDSVETLTFTVKYLQGDKLELEESDTEELIKLKRR